MTFVRAPKHFNIGRLKIKNFNSKFYKLYIPLNLCVSMQFLFEFNLIFTYIKKHVEGNVLNSMSSCQVCTETFITFSIMWLGILY